MVDHPQGHVSFASTHGKAPFSPTEVPKLYAENETTTQMLWPDHCVQGTPGAEIESGLQERLNKLGSKVKFIEKVSFSLGKCFSLTLMPAQGTNVGVDSYSGFADNQYTAFTGLSRILHEHGIHKVVIVGWVRLFRESIWTLTCFLCKTGDRLLCSSDSD